MIYGCCSVQWRKKVRRKKEDTGSLFETEKLESHKGTRGSQRKRGFKCNKEDAVLKLEIGSRVAVREQHAEVK